MKNSEPCYSRDAFRLDEKNRRWSISDWVPGISSEFIRHILDPEILSRAQREGVIFYQRESSFAQKARGNLNDAVLAARRRLRDLDVHIVEVFSEVAHSSVNSPRMKLMLAIRRAREAKKLLVAAERDRLLRCEFYDGTRRLEAPRVGELMEFAAMTYGASIVTIEHPNALGRSSQIKRGQAAKNARGGRPPIATHGAGWCIRRRKALLPVARELRKRGLSFARIVAELKSRNCWKCAPSHQTISDWLSL